VTAEQNLKKLGIDLGAVSAPVANYVNAVQTGSLLYLAGKGPRAVGMGSLPMGIPVEIEVIVEVS
jgi:enamine deaminase RidA (YjgF/YER057c/UK114 family)